MSTLNWRCCAKNLNPLFCNSDILIREKRRTFELNLVSVYSLVDGELYLQYPKINEDDDGLEFAEIDCIYEANFKDYEFVTLAEL